MSASRVDGAHDAAIVDHIAEAVRAAAQDPEVQAKLGDQGSIAVANSPQGFATPLQSEAQAWKGKGVVSVDDVALVCNDRNN